MDIHTELQKFIPFIEKLSPLLATALGFPGAGLIVSALLHVFGVEQPEALPGAITTDPMAQIKIKQIESQVASLQAQTQVTQQEIADRQDARAKKVANRDDWIIHFIAMVVTIGFFGYLACFKAGVITYDKDTFHQLVVMETIILMFYF